MKPHWFFILLSTASGPQYGTAIQEDVRALSAGAVRLWPATLYGSLEELVERGWLEEVDESERPERVAGRERFYRLTATGRSALADETSRLEGLAREARVRMAALVPASAPGPVWVA